VSAGAPGRTRNGYRSRPSSRVGGAHDVGLTLLRQAEFWVDATRSNVVGGKLKNLGTGGSALDAQFGSTAPSSFFNGTALVLNGATGNYASTPDAVALDISGNLCLVADVAPTDWTPGSTVRLGGKDNAYVLNLNSTGQLALTYIDSGLVLRTAATSSPVGFADGARRQVAVTYVAGTGVNDVRFWTRNTSSDPWVQFGSTQSSAGVDIRVGGNAAAFGATDTGTAPLTGSLYRFSIYASVGASNEPPSSGAVFDADFAKPFDTTSFTASTGQTVTLTRSVSGVDTNDPTVLSHTGVNYLYLPGSPAANNYASIPDSADIDLLNADVEFVLHLRAEALAISPLLFSKTFGAAGWWGNFTTTGQLQLGYTIAGDPTTIRTGTSTGVITTGTDVWVKIKRNYTTGLIEFFTAPTSAAEPVSWTSAGTFAGTAGSFNDNPNEFCVGGNSTSSNFVGRMYRCIVRNTTTATTVADINFTRLSTGAETSFTATTGQTVTISRRTAGLKAEVVVRPEILFGVDDWLEVPDSALLNFGATDIGTFIVVVRLWNTAAGGLALMNKRDATAVAPAGPGWNLRIGGGGTDTQFVTYDGTTSPQSGPAGGWTAGALTLHGGILNGSSDQEWSFRNNTYSTTITSAVNSISNALAMRIGALSNGASGLDGAVVAAMVFRKVLSAAEIAAINTYYGTA